MITLPRDAKRVFAKFVKENQTMINRYVATKIKKAIEHEKDKITLWYFEGDSHGEIIAERHYNLVLEKLMNAFIEREEYEDAEKVKSTIIDYNVNKVIKESIEFNKE